MTTQTSTVRLVQTPAYDGDELYGDADGCRHCEATEFLLIEINAARGERKWVQACRECSREYERAPRGMYDPTVLGYTEGADYSRD
jgi:hypothetical protein